MRLFGVGLPVVLVGGWLLAQAGALSGTAPVDLGVQNGQLKPPSLTRNSVSSQAKLHPGHPQREQAQVDPLPLKPAGADASVQTLVQVLQGTPGISVVEHRPDYVRAEARTPWLRFVDDLEFWVDPAQQAVQLRSASRLGREDFGANRERVEAIRARYLALP